MIEITKDLVGKKLYLYPWGNNVTRGKRQQKILEIIVDKVARVNMTYTSYWIGYEGQRRHHQAVIRFKGNRLDDGYNGGYHAYSSIQEVHFMLARSKLVSLVSRNFRYDMDYDDIPVIILKSLLDCKEIDHSHIDWTGEDYGNDD